MPNELGIERIAGYADARVTQKVGRASTPTTNTGTNPHQGKVARATSEVSDQNEFIVIQRRLVVVRRRNGLKFEVHGLISRNLECFSESVFRIAVLILGFGSDKSYRSANDGF